MARYVLFDREEMYIFNRYSKFSSNISSKEMLFLKKKKFTIQLEFLYSNTVTVASKICSPLEL